MATQTEMRVHLKSRGFHVGARDPRLNRNYPGAFMVAEPYGEDETPTDDGSNGPWCIVGDDLDALVLEAYESGIADHFGMGE